MIGCACVIWSKWALTGNAYRRGFLSILLPLWSNGNESVHLQKSLALDYPNFCFAADSPQLSRCVASTLHTVMHRSIEVISPPSASHVPSLPFAPFPTGQQPSSSPALSVSIPFPFFYVTFPKLSVHPTGNSSPDPAKVSTHAFLSIRLLSRLRVAADRIPASTRSKTSSSKLDSGDTPTAPLPSFP
jgi:hypothetical protein